MPKPPPTSWPVQKTDAAWRAQLSPMQYKIARQGGTERAFTGPWWDEKSDGVYHCICCDAALFDARHKYDSGTGWPSFTQSLTPQAIAEQDDRSFFMRRTETVCARCGAHLGHVFPDGPPPTGLRYCLNGHALQLRKRRTT